MNRASHGGQAIVEFLIGLVAVLTLLAGLFQIASLIATHTRTMAEARRQAALLAVQETDPGILLSGASYIRDWQPGRDGKPYTRDDTFTPADAIAFHHIMVERAVPAPSAWEILNQTRNHPLGSLHGAPNPCRFFGLIRGSDHKTVPLVPAAQNLFYRANAIEVRSDVWMTWTKGLY